MMDDLEGVIVVYLHILSWVKERRLSRISYNLLPVFVCETVPQDTIDAVSILKL